MRITTLKLRLARCLGSCLGVAAKCFWFPKKSVADVLWRPLRLIAAAPKTAFFCFLGFNAVFLLIGGLTALIARLVYPAGAAMIWVGGSFLLIRFLARLVAYPGSVNSVRRSIEYGFGKSISTKTKEVCNITNSAVNSLLMRQDVQNAVEAMAMARGPRKSFVQQLQRMLNVSLQQKTLDSAGLRAQTLVNEWVDAFDALDRLLLDLNPATVAAATAAAAARGPASSEGLTSRTPPISPGKKTERDGTPARKDMSTTHNRDSMNAESDIEAQAVGTHEVNSEHAPASPSATRTAQRASSAGLKLPALSVAGATGSGPIHNAVNLKIPSVTTSPGGGPSTIPKHREAFATAAIGGQIVVTAARRLGRLTNELFETASVFYDKEPPAGYLRLIRSAWQSLWPTKAVANLDLLRADLIARYDAQRISIKASDGTLLDGAIIKCTTKGDHADLHRNLSHGAFSGVGSGANTAEPPKIAPAGSDRRIVVLCNPNAAYYEGHHYWVDFYNRLGLDVGVWNYRGYGASKGTPSPARCRSDILAVLRTMREQHGYTRFALHGESIGGLAACYAASVDPHVEFLLADRTFSSLQMAGRLLIGNWTSALVRYIVCWPENNVRPFIDARCYKVVANDTNDDIIHDSASLRTGIAEWSVRGLHVRKRKKQARASAAIATELANDPSVSKGTADQVVVDMAAVETHPAHLGASRGHDEADDDDDGGGDDGDAHLPLMPGTGSRVPSASATSGSNTNGSVDDSVVLSETAAENILSGGSLAVEKFRDMAERMLELAGTCDAVTTSQASGSEEGPGASALKGWYAAIERLTARAILVFSSQKVVAAMQARRGQMAASETSIDSGAQESSLGADSSAQGNTSSNGAAAAPEGPYPATATAAFVADNEWVLIVMGCLLKLDGGCANNLGEAREAGFQGFRTFVLNLLIWGAVGAARLVDPKRRFGLLNRFHHEQCAQSGNFDWRKIHELKDLIRKEAPSSDLDVLQLQSFLDFLQVVFVFSSTFLPARRV
eukprot:INCI14792.2.p1 GENE.INCI14792.2~~INCI14792.2.p1  ORF type:complete len:1013 (-),score=162.38 INCI14792.2:1831-4869(-)